MLINYKLFVIVHICILCLFCSRSKDIVEPLLKVQWYVKCEGMAQKAIEVCMTLIISLITSNLFLLAVYLNKK